MSKYYQNQPVKKQKVKKARWWLFWLLMFLYVAAFLGATVYGLKYLWSYLDAYEASRSKVALNDYMDHLTDAHICDMGIAVMDQIDTNLQSEEECREIILESISGGVTYAKKSSECTDTRQVYVLRSGGQVIGQFAIESGAADEYGFTPWSFAEESFDFSFLVWNDTVSMTVPSDYSVSVNGHVLGEEYIIEDNIHYEEVEAYYEDYDLPVKVTYQAGPFLGQLEMTASDPEGNPAVFDENTDWSQFYLNCSEEETKALDEFTAEFVERYVAFTGSNKNTRYGTYDQLIELVVADSDLASRLHAAIEGLQFGQSKGDEVVSITTHLQLRIEEGKYLCDVTYEVDTTGKEGVVRTSTSAKLTIVKTDSGLLLESMNIY
ncbi:MAG: hypothetical protein IJ375_04765 [Oscillospiraceae bacterium]|nr:hypothetical protein [Oscillospiraceae bacterium]